MNPTAYEECQKHLKELEQRAEILWQHHDILNGTWGKSKTRLLHVNLCDTHYRLESVPWSDECYSWHYMMDREANALVEKHHETKYEIPLNQQ